MLPTRASCQDQLCNKYTLFIYELADILAYEVDNFGIVNACFGSLFDRLMLCRNSRAQSVESCLFLKTIHHQITGQKRIAHVAARGPIVYKPLVRHINNKNVDNVFEESLPNVGQAASVSASGQN